MLADSETLIVPRVSFITKRGEFWSYPYSHMSAIHAPNPGEVIITCGCSTYARICITGRELNKLILALHAQRVLAIEESDNLQTMAPGTLVRTITFYERETSQR